MKKVTIIIPVYNRENLVTYTLESIQNQSYENFECLLIDDGSDDNTVKVMKNTIKEDARFTVLHRPENYIKGPAGCRNYGLELAQGEYIQFFDSDDLMDKEHLQMKVNAYSADTDLVVCQLIEFKNNNINNLYGRSSVDDKNDLSRHVTGEINYYLPGPMWKRDIIGSDRFLTDIKIYEDLLFNLINRIKCKHVKVIDKALIYYRRHDETTTAKINQDIKLLNEKRLAWENIYNVSMGEVKDKHQRSSIKYALLRYSCLNFYYLLCQKSFVSSVRQVIDMFKYSSSVKDFFTVTTLVILSAVPFFTSKGYFVYKMKNEK